MIAAEPCQFQPGEARAWDAYVSLHPDATVTAEEIIAHCRERMAAYKYPRTVVVVDELPKNASGKILRRVLRAGVS